jgi:hypothetical protein
MDQVYITFFLKYEIKNLNYKYYTWGINFHLNFYEGEQIENH